MLSPLGGLLLRSLAASVASTDHGHLMLSTISFHYSVPAMFILWRPDDFFFFPALMCKPCNCRCTTCIYFGGFFLLGGSQTVLNNVALAPKWWEMRQSGRFFDGGFGLSLSARYTGWAAKNIQVDRAEPVPEPFCHLFLGHPVVA